MTKCLVQLFNKIIMLFKIKIIILDIIVSLPSDFISRLNWARILWQRQVLTMLGGKPLFVLIITTIGNFYLAIINSLMHISLFYKFIALFLIEFVYDSFVSDARSSLINVKHACLFIMLFVRFYWILGSLPHLRRFLIRWWLPLFGHYFIFCNWIRSGFF